jgi:hypothetical protein
MNKFILKVDPVKVDREFKMIEGREIVLRILIRW